MNAAKRWIKAFRDVSVSDRQAAAVAITSGVVLTALIVLWLSMSTRTALLNQQLEKLDRQQAELIDGINTAWTDIGEASAPRMMEDRARRMGFRPPDKVEYLVTTPEPALAPATAITQTVTP